VVAEAVGVRRSGLFRGVAAASVVAGVLTILTGGEPVLARSLLIAGIAYAVVSLVVERRECR
jgi:hypothetical protein